MKPSSNASENQLAGEEHGLRKFVRDLQAELAQFRDDVGADTDAQLGMEPEVGGEAAVFAEVIGHLLFGC